MDHGMMPPERFDPMDIQYEDITVRRMFDRYDLAASFYGGEGSILDAGCGFGYGTAQLSEATGALAIGVDVSQETLDVATERHGKNGCEFRMVDLTAEVPACPMLVAIDFIEHLVHPERFVWMAKHAIGDHIFIGWPLHAMGGRNTFHVSEPTREDVVGWFYGWKMLTDTWEPGSSRNYQFLCFERES